nr:hypothetical protein [Tanacetum cinerariifolium]
MYLPSHYFHEILMNLYDYVIPQLSMFYPFCGFVITYIPGSSGLRRFFRYAMFIYSFYLCYVLSLYPFTERYAQPYFFPCLIRQNALQTLLPQIREEIRDEFRTGSGVECWWKSPTSYDSHMA